MPQYERDIVNTLVRRMEEPRSLIQILLGPRQTGKSTAVLQALRRVSIPYVYSEVPQHGESADWVRAQWQQSRNLLGPTSQSALLVIDEIHYVSAWSSVVKALWDEDAAAGIDLRVVLTGSSATLLKSGLSESLTGRFEIIRSTHWTYRECRDAFGFSLDDFLFFGGYPGAARLISSVDRWQRYIVDAMIEPSISKDVLALENVRNPALMTATYGRYRDFLLSDPDRRGRLVESAIGAYLIALSELRGYTLNWWRDGSNEVDFVVGWGEDVVGIEVKSGRVRSTGGLTAFALRFPGARTLVVGSPVCTVESFLLGEHDPFLA